MSNESDEALEDRLERIQRRAENFRELLKDGEEVTIACQDGEMRIDESYRSKFERKHAKLYGRLMSVEAQMSAGLTPYVFGLASVIVVIFGLQLEWWEPIVGPRVCELLNRWWFYVVLPAFVLYLMYLACGRWGKYVYRWHRKNLLALIAAEALDRDILLVMLRDEADLDDVIRELKLDAGD
jgi:hypothetical protein